MGLAAGGQGELRPADRPPLSVHGGEIAARPRRRAGPAGIALFLGLLATGCGGERPEPPTAEEDAAARARLIGSAWRLAAVDPHEGPALAPPEGTAEPPRVSFGAEAVGEGLSGAAGGEERTAGGERSAERAVGPDRAAAAERGPGAREGGRPATLRDPDLRPLVGHGGCNPFRGSYRVGGEGELAVSDLAGGGSTCLSAEVMELESAFLSALSEVTAYRFDGDALLLDSPLGELRLVPEDG